MRLPRGTLFALGVASALGASLALDFDVETLPDDEDSCQQHQNQKSPVEDLAASEEAEAQAAEAGAEACGLSFRQLRAQARRGEEQLLATATATAAATAAARAAGTATAKGTTAAAGAAARDDDKHQSAGGPEALANMNDHSPNQIALVEGTSRNHYDLLGTAEQDRSLVEVDRARSLAVPQQQEQEEQGMQQLSQQQQRWWRPWFGPPNWGPPNWGQPPNNNNGWGAPAPPPWSFNPPAPAPAPPPNGGQIRSYSTVTGYHQTSPDICSSILREGFHLGHSGWCGGAIYFALSQAATETKATGVDSHKGCMLQAQVYMGRIKHMPKTCGRVNGDVIHNEGYDSIVFDPGDGPELVVYRPSQVSHIRRLW